MELDTSADTFIAIIVVEAYEWHTIYEATEITPV